MKTYLQAKGRIMLMQQWQYLNLASNTFCVLIPVKGMSYRQIISSHLYVR